MRKTKPLDIEELKQEINSANSPIAIINVVLKMYINVIEICNQIKEERRNENSL